MDASRLLEVLDDLILETSEAGVDTLLKSFETTYQQYVAQPNAANGDLVTKALGLLATTLEGLPSNQFIPSKFHILSSLGGTSLVGVGLKEKLEELLSDGRGVPAVVLTELQTLRKDAEAFHARASSLSRDLRLAGIKKHQVPNGEAELTILFPGLSFTEDLDSLAHELDELDFSLRTICEYIGEDTSSLKLRSVGQGSPLMIALAATPAVVKVISVLVNDILGVYKNVQDIRLKEAEIQNMRKSSALLESQEGLVRAQTELKNAQKVLIESGLGEIVKKLGTNSKLANGPRRIELEGHAIVLAVNYLAGRIDEGVDVEGAVNSPDIKVVEGENTVTKPNPDAVDIRGLVASNSLLLRAHSRGEVEIFNLGDGSNSEELLQELIEKRKNDRKKKGRRKKK